MGHSKDEAVGQRASFNPRKGVPQMLFGKNGLLAKVQAFQKNWKIRTLWKKLKTLDWGPIAFQLHRHGRNYQQVQQAIAQYLMFLVLIYLHPNIKIVPTQEIDVVWHYHILDTTKYESDCQQLFGRFLHHFPYFGLRGELDRQNLDAAFAQTSALFQQYFGSDSLVHANSSKSACELLVDDSSPKPGDCEPLQNTNQIQERPRVDIEIDDVMRDFLFN